MFNVMLKLVLMIFYFRIFIFLFSFRTPPKTLDKSFEEKARNLLDDSMNIVDKAMEVHTNSNKSKISSTKTRNDAEEIEKKLRELLDRIKGTGWLALKLNIKSHWLNIRKLKL